MKKLSMRLVLLAGLATLVACSNPFAPTKETGEGGNDGPAPPATTPEQLLDNLRRAMRDRDRDLYETLIDVDFWFTETDCQGDLVFANGREEELEIMGGSRDGSRKGIFDLYRTFDYEFSLLSRSVELGSEHPDAYEGDPDGHPDEDWEVFRGQVEMLILDDTGVNGFRVSQIMTYKLRLEEDGTYKMIRWVDDPLAGDCDTGKLATGLSRWAAAKQSIQ